MAGEASVRRPRRAQPKRRRPPLHRRRLRPRRRHPSIHRRGRVSPLPRTRSVSCIPTTGRLTRPRTCGHWRRMAPSSAGQRTLPQRSSLRRWRPRISAWSVAVEPGTTLEDFVAAYCEMNTTPCTDIQGRAEPIVAEGGDPYSGVLRAVRSGDIQAFFPTWYDEGASESIWTQPASAEGQIYAMRAGVPKRSRLQRLIEEFVRSLCIGCGG